MVAPAGPRAAAPEYSALITDVDPPTLASWRSLLDRLTVASVVGDRDGTIVYANDAVAALLGWAADDLVGRSIETLVPPRLVAVHQSAFRRWADGDDEHLDGRYLRLPALTPSGDEVPVGMVLNPVDSPDGDPLVLAFIRPRDASPEAVNAVALDLVSVLSQELPVEEAVDGLLRAIGDRLDWDAVNLWVVDESRDRLRALALWSAEGTDHGGFREVTRSTDLVAGEGIPGRVWATGIPFNAGRLTDLADFPREEAARTAGLRSGFAFPVESDGHMVGVIEMFRSRDEPIDPEHVTVLAGIGAHLGPYLHRVSTQERDRRAERRQRLITDGTALLARWLDYPDPLDDVCHLLVPDVADACVIDLVRDGRLERLGQAYVSAEFEADVARLHEVVPLEMVAAGPMAAIRTAETQAYDDIGVAEMSAGLPEEVPADLLDRLAPSSTIIVPLIGRGSVVGAMTLTHRGGAYDADDRRFVEELGRHIGLAVANAALFERERAVAEALQQSLLPPRLPDVPGLEIACRYEPGGSRLVVGGDFYDLFEVEPGCWLALVGDVCGTGAEAAAITSQVRYTARALAPRVDSPAELLEVINTALLERGDTRFCTALVARLTPDADGVDVTIASGGHPPPVLISRKGTRLVDCPGTLLGIYTSASFDEVDLRLGRGESLALYTDGVTETRNAQGEMLGEERLVEVLDACVEEHAEKTADQLVQAAVDHADFAPADDIAILVIRHL